MAGQQLCEDDAKTYIAAAIEFHRDGLSILCRNRESLDFVGPTCRARNSIEFPSESSPEIRHDLARSKDNSARLGWGPRVLAIAMKIVRSDIGSKERSRAVGNIRVSLSTIIRVGNGFLRNE